MAKLRSSSFGELKHLERAFNERGQPMKKFAGQRINQGMITTIDPADLPEGALLLAKNARVRFDKTSRRVGTKLMLPTKPNSLRILNYGYYRKNNGNEFFYRFDKDEIYLRGASSWTQQDPGATGALTGGDNDRFSLATAFDRFFFANGVDPIQEIDTTADEYNRLSNSGSIDTAFKYITAFYNRIVGANLGGGSPDATMVGWSADSGITGSDLDEWDGTVDETAGRGPLVDAPGDLGDPITGIFGLTNIMLLLREKSIYIVSKQPIPSNPFNFYPAFPGLGCDCPNSAKLTLNALAWLDTFSKTIWAYTPNGSPEPIGRNVEKDILRAMDDPEAVFSSYSPQENEYTILIPLVGSNFTRAWTFNFRTKAWVYDEFEGVSAAADIEIAEARTTIDELQGTIDNLVGTINDLAPAEESLATRIYGRTDGESLIESVDDDTDPAVSGGVSDSGTYETIIQSKEFELPTDDIYVGMIRVEYEPLMSGSIILEYQKNRGEWQTAKTVTFLAGDIGKTKLLRFSKNIKCRRFSWRVLATSGQFDLLDYEVHVYDSAPAR